VSRVRNARGTAPLRESGQFPTEVKQVLAMCATHTRRNVTTAALAVGPYLKRLATEGLTPVAAEVCEVTQVHRVQ
jgi:hypothetical protein